MVSGDRRGVVDIQFKFTNASFVCCIGKVDAHATIVVVVVFVLRVVCVIKVLYLIVVYTVFRSSVSRCGEFLIAVFHQRVWLHGGTDDRDGFTPQVDHIVDGSHHHDSIRGYQADRVS